MYRLFVGVPLPEDIRLRLDGLCGGVPGARWVPSENFHITLRFIGDVPGDMAEEIGYALAHVRTKRFDIELSSVGHFSSGSEVRVLWAGVRKCPELLALHERIDSVARKLDLPDEQRRFIPHVTLAKLRDANLPKVQEWLATNSLFRAGPITVDHFVLYSSYRQSSGSLYTPEAEYMLAA
ncbi:MAG: RNA 2',3'-cyclic phosphodiesterase [Alphaproteobacteria bacterium]|nr:RNA 2',3'-cyclic phosphodiesterase [Alphaproteobacteria bacterium]